MTKKKSLRLNKLTKEFNVGSDRILSFLQEKGFEELKLTSKISDDIYQLLLNEFQSEKQTKLAAKIEANKRIIEQEIIEKTTKIEETENDKIKITSTELKSAGTPNAAQFAMRWSALARSSSSSVRQGSLTLKNVWLASP